MGSNHARRTSADPVVVFFVDFVFLGPSWKWLPRVERAGSSIRGRALRHKPLHYSPEANNLRAVVEVVPVVAGAHPVVVGGGVVGLVVGVRRRVVELAGLGVLAGGLGVEGSSGLTVESLEHLQDTQVMSGHCVCVCVSARLASEHGTAVGTGLCSGDRPLWPRPRSPPSPCAAHPRPPAHRQWPCLLVQTRPAAGASMLACSARPHPRPVARACLVDEDCVRRSRWK